MIKNFFIKTSFSILFALGVVTSVYGDGHRIRRPVLPEAQKQEIMAKMQAHKASLASGESKRTAQSLPHPDPAFQGWWKMETRGNEFGFGLGAETDDIDSYIFIDVSQFDPAENPIIEIQTICGTPTCPRQCTPLDVGEGIFLNAYYVPESTALVNILDLNGPFFHPANGQSFWSLKLQADKQTIVASSDSQPQWEGYGAVSTLLRKVQNPPPIRPYDDSGSSFPSVTDPVNMAKYIFNALELNHNQPQNVNLHDGDYLSFNERNAVFQKMLNGGITFETEIRKIRVSQPGVHFNDEVSSPGTPFLSRDLLTDIFTDGFAYALAGSTVEIKGFKGKWAKLNGIYVNGVSYSEEGGIPNPSPEHVDASSSTDPKKGTFRNVYNHFLLDFDSSDCNQFPRDELGYATHVEGHPTVKVTHRFSSDMQYPEFYAAIRALFFSIYKISQHNAYVAIFKPGSMFLVDTWDELKQAAATDNFWGSDLFPGDNLMRTRTTQRVPSGFYNNVTKAERGVTTYNDPFGLTQLPGSYFDYNIVLSNYIVQPKNLYWAIAGTPQGPTQFDPTIVGYKPLIPGPQRAQFVSTLGDLKVVNGNPVPQNPDPVHYSIYASVDDPENDVRNANGYYIGLIDPSLTKGKRVGYLRWIDEVGLDPFFYMATATFPPEVPVTVKYGREAYCKVISQVTRYFQTDLDCDAVILDVRTNNGGFILTEQNLAEFFGDDRFVGFYYWTKKDEGNSPLISLNDSSQYASYNNVVSQDAFSFGQFFVRQNEANYGPGVVFRGSPGRHKKVIVLTDNVSASGGDIFPHLFLGEKLDGNLGSNTSCKIIGDIDGRLKGAATNRNPLPVSKFNNIYYGSNGLPFSPIRFRADYAFGEPGDGLTPFFYNEQTDFVAPFLAPTLRGTAGGAPLPNDWESTVWQDIGVIKVKEGHFSKHIKKRQPCWSDRSSWRDCWLEQAILEAID